MLVRAPTRMGFWFWSDRITAPHQMLASSPTMTSPMITAVGATKALGEIRGALPLYSIIMRHPPCICITIFDVSREINNGSRTRSEEHTSELQSRGLISYAVFCLKKKKHEDHCDAGRVARCTQSTSRAREW